MRRRTFIRLLPPALGALILPLQPVLKLDKAPKPPKISKQDIEKAVRRFTKAYHRPNGHFEWDGHLTKDLGLDSLDTVELIMACEKELNTYIPDLVAEYITTPRQLADVLFTGLNHAVVLYEKPNFEGPYTLLFTTAAAKASINLSAKRGYATIQPPGSVYKPEGYEIAIDGKPLGKKNKVWQDANFVKRMNSNETMKFTYAL
jgi:acyl carrier protein